MKDLKIYNAFGITPTSTYTAAGLDFYVPDICPENEIEREEILTAFSNSYKKSIEELNDYLNIFYEVLMENKVSYKVVFNIEESEQYFGEFEDEYEEFVVNNLFNFLHLYLSLDSYLMTQSSNNDYRKICLFTKIYLVCSKDHKVGLRLNTSDHVLINSGIKVALEPNTVGIFFNKSGRGNKGFDTRACVVDEDYAGFVHLSLAYTKNNANDGVFYCGDKITQMVILPVLHYNCVCTDKTNYDNIMKDSQRGAAGFGSSDIKH